jgi:predicted RNA-binding protein
MRGRKQNKGDSEKVRTEDIIGDAKEIRKTKSSL